MTFDDIRAANPALGLALYALEPGGPVVLEILLPDGGIVPFTGDSAAGVLDRAFPPEPTGGVFD